MANEVIKISPHAGFQEKFCRTNVDVCVAGGAVSTGKMNPLYTRVLTPHGWVCMGDLKVGDMVCTPFGAPAKILQIFEHYDKEIYRLTTNDGRQADCGLEHLWGVRTKKQVSKYRASKDPRKYLSVYDTQQIIDALAVGKQIYIPLPFAQEREAREYVISPYVMGVMIGDGCLTDSTWTANRRAIPISSNESDVIQKVCKLVNATRVYESKGTYTQMIYTPHVLEYHNYIKTVGLNTYSYNKFIPQEYLEGSVQQRRELLAGLLDADGHTTPQYTLSFSTTSCQLKDDVVYLCRSLGYQTRVSEDRRPNKYTKGVCYEIRILTTDAPFSSLKHLKNYRQWLSEDKRYCKPYDHVSVTKVEKVCVADARCIYIDDPTHLYIIDDFLTTHNSFGAWLAVAERMLDPDFRGVFLRNNIDDFKQGGGLLDTAKEVFGNSVRIVKSDNARVEYLATGAVVEVTHVADQTRAKVEQRFKGRQSDLVYFDEGTGFTWETFVTIATRNRGKTGRNPQILITTNPKRNHWLRKMVDWYIGEDGVVDEEREGRVRYFFVKGTTVDDLVWGNSKEEVYRQCAPLINRLLKGAFGKKKPPEDAWKALIKSFTYYQGHMAENTENMERNANYLGSVAMAGGANALNFIEGNWNADEEDDKNNLLTLDEIDSVFTNDDQRNGDRWVTCDLADTGTDNFIALAWDGLHVIDIHIMNRSTPRENAETLRYFAQKNDVGEGHIIYDAIRGRYINDYIPNAIPFESYRAAFGVNALQYMKLKDICYGKLLFLIKNNSLSFSDTVAKTKYRHQKLTSTLTVAEEFTEELRVVRYVDGPNGKKRLMTKKEMNKNLGRGRSMDLLDPCAMRMMPLLEIADGYELETARKQYEDEQEAINNGQRVDIYDDATWF